MEGSKIYKNTILIISENGDTFVDNVIHWLNYFKTEIRIIRINETNILTNIQIEYFQNEFQITLEISNGSVVNLSSIYAYYYRRGALNLNSNIDYFDIKEKSLTNLINSLNQHFKKEINSIISFVHFYLRNKGIYNLGSYFDLNVNKNINLLIAQKIGLDIPEFIITNNIEKVFEFINKHDKVITKAIEFPGDFFNKGTEYVSYSHKTNIISKKILNQFINKQSSKKLQPTLFQKYIEKDFEIRIFFKNNSFYPMAIFSQSNPKTKIDFRNYDLEKENRNVPFILPLDIKKKLIILMQSLNYSTGSFDLIYTNGKYYFIEVNTVGQLGWLNNNCNYYLGKKIALELSNGKN